MSIKKIMAKGGILKFIKNTLSVQAHYFYIALGGALGAIARTLICSIISNQILAILVCNIGGTFLLACVTEMGRRIYPELKNSIVVGFCGGLSIFASFSKDSVYALKHHDYFLFFANFGANFALCIASVFFAFWLASKLRAMRGGAKGDVK